MQTEAGRLEDALASIEDFCAQNDVPFDGSRARLDAMREFAQIVVEAPEHLLHLQSPGLAHDGSHQAIEALAGLQRRWTDLAAELDVTLYLDALPAEGTLKQAVLTFREGGAWYRMFQGRWRSAVATHKSLQRTKRRVAAVDRLGELERLIALSRLKERWRTDPAWLQYIGWAAPSVPVPLDAHVALAAWNRSAKRFLEDLGTAVFSPAELTAERARALRRAFTGFGAQVSAALSALTAIDALLPRLVEATGGSIGRKCVETATALGDAIAAQAPWFEANVVPGATLPECRRACEAALERRDILRAVDDDEEIKELLGDRFTGIETPIDAALGTLAFGHGLERHPLPDQIILKLKADHPLEAAQRISEILTNVLEGLQNVQAFEADLSAYGEFDLDRWAGAAADGDLSRSPPRSGSASEPPRTASTSWCHGRSISPGAGRRRNSDWRTSPTCLRPDKFRQVTLLPPMPIAPTPRSCAMRSGPRPSSAAFRA